MHHILHSALEPLLAQTGTRFGPTAEKKIDKWRAVPHEWWRSYQETWTSFQYPLSQSHYAASSQLRCQHMLHCSVLSHSHGGEKWGPFHLHGYQKQVPNVLHSLHYTQCASLVAQAPMDYPMKAPLVLHSANMNSHVWMQKLHPMEVFEPLPICRHVQMMSQRPFKTHK